MWLFDCIEHTDSQVVKYATHCFYRRRPPARYSSVHRLCSGWFYLRDIRHISVMETSDGNKNIQKFKFSCYFFMQKFAYKIIFLHQFSPHMYFIYINKIKYKMSNSFYVLKINIINIDIYSTMPVLCRKPFIEICLQMMASRIYLVGMTSGDTKRISETTTSQNFHNLHAFE